MIKVSVNGEIKELKKGEKSGFIEKFSKDDFLSSMHLKYSSSEL